jgi:hypothetical protein
LGCEAHGLSASGKKSESINRKFGKGNKASEGFGKTNRNEKATPMLDLR